MSWSCVTGCSKGRKRESTQHYNVNTRSIFTRIVEKYGEICISILQIPTTIISLPDINILLAS
ncbi:hypothetical protein GDO81_003419 [Engystomops pustulosus]|uniref:Uncharacterized protein n=1 Tax=Engystomops pustulosus TaxID=76066 RepID=A0AAV6ZWE0_ENGPU|nr:hypothetical protein GDO81_003419 [Engystomops pustulosus]